jgi:hypothetical protein
VEGWGRGQNTDKDGEIDITQFLRLWQKLQKPDAQTFAAFFFFLAVKIMDSSDFQKPLIPDKKSYRC